MSTSAPTTSFYHYTPSHILPAVFGGLSCLSLALHVYQNFHYRFWRITFFIVWAGAVFTAGWFCRLASSFDHEIASIGTRSANLYIAQTTLILGGPPIYAAAEYNILSRLLHYIPYHAPLHPHRVYVFFVYLSALVESLTAAGGSIMARDPGDISVYVRGETLISIALVLQGTVGCLFIGVLAHTHRRTSRAGRVSKNVARLFTMLYGTSTLVLIRCIFRAVEAFSNIPKEDPNYKCTGVCRLTRNEWYLYVFEATPMVIYSLWLNVIHPGRLLPRERLRYLDLDGKTERIGAGWVDRRSKWETFADPFDISGQIKGKPSHEEFWNQPECWPEVDDGTSFASGNASNVKGRNGPDKGRNPVGVEAVFDGVRYKPSKGMEESLQRML